MDVELKTIATRKWVGNFSNEAPLLDISDDISNGDVAIDISTTPNTIWLCNNNKLNKPDWRIIKTNKNSYKDDKEAIKGILDKYDVTGVVYYTYDDEDMIIKKEWFTDNSRSVAMCEATYVYTNAFLDKKSIKDVAINETYEFLYNWNTVNNQRTSLASKGMV